MESNKYDINNVGDQHQHQQNRNKKNRGGQRRNDALENLNLENLTREEMTQLIRKLLDEKYEAQETTTRQAEEFSQRIVQLEQKNAEVQEDLHQKMGEIVEMHKEVEKKSEQLAEKAKEIDALLMQLNESTSHEHQIGLPTEQQEQMKIQLSLETWYDWLAFVPRYRLGQIIPMIVDRKFASIVQKFLHEYGDITIDCIQIVAPYDDDPIGHPQVRARQNNRPPFRFEMAETQMPVNIKNFNKFELSYLDQSVLNFMQKFRQNGLLDNANLWFDANLSPKDIVQPVLRHLLPLINGIVSIYLMDSAQLVAIYDAGNSKEIYELNMKMMEETRILTLDCDDPKNLQANRIDLYCRWLYQTAHADEKTRQLLLFRIDVDSAPISLFIDRLKKDFQMATDSVTFLIRIVLPKAFQSPEAICLDNGKTKERFVTKVVEAEPNLGKDKLALQISRHPLASKKKWIVLGKEYYQKTIYLTKELKVVEI